MLLLLLLGWSHRFACSWAGRIASLRLLLGVNDPQELWTPPSFDIAAELKHLIDTEMRARGWSESATPDMVIAFLVVNDVQELKLMEAERAGEVPDLVGIGEGALLIEIVDGQTGLTIWLGGAIEAWSCGHLQASTSLPS